MVIEREVLFLAYLASAAPEFDVLVNEFEKPAQPAEGKKRKNSL